jgi:hypothetical protein
MNGVDLSVSRNPQDFPRHSFFWKTALPSFVASKSLKSMAGVFFQVKPRRASYRLATEISK